MGDEKGYTEASTLLLVPADLQSGDDGEMKKIESDGFRQWIRKEFQVELWWYRISHFYFSAHPRVRDNPAASRFQIRPQTEKSLDNEQHCIYQYFLN